MEGSVAVLDMGVSQGSSQTDSPCSNIGRRWNRPLHVVDVPATGPTYSCGKMGMQEGRRKKEEEVREEALDGYVVHFY